MEKGRINIDLPSLKEIRATAEENLSKLPAKYKKLTNPPPYPVNLSRALERVIAELTKKLTEKN
jgi:hypothetical protein